MTKNKKSFRFVIICLIVLILILFLPIPKKHSSEEGSAFTLNSLTYKLVEWNMYENSEKPYKETEIYFMPNNFLNIQAIWEEKYNDLRLDGYGAISSNFKITKIENSQVWIEEITDNKYAIKDCVVGENNIIKYGKNFSFNDLKVGDTLKISYDGAVLETYPCTLGMIYKIELC